MQEIRRPEDTPSDANHIGEWLHWLKLRGLAAATLRLYEREIHRLAAAYDPPLADLKLEDLTRYLRRAGGIQKTVNNRIGAMRSYYGYLHEFGLAPENVALKIPRAKEQQRMPRPLKDRSRSFAKLDPESRHAATFLLETGLQISEACRLRVDAPIPHEITVTGRAGRQRVVHLTPEARSALAALGGKMPCGARAMQRRFEKAGFSPKQLRQTLGYELAMSNADLGEIQDILGHASPQSTRVYAKYSAERVRDAQERRRTKFGQLDGDSPTN